MGQKRMMGATCPLVMTCRGMMGDSMSCVPCWLKQVGPLCLPHIYPVGSTFPKKLIGKVSLGNESKRETGESQFPFLFVLPCMLHGLGLGRMDLGLSGQPYVLVGYMCSHRNGKCSGSFKTKASFFFRILVFKILTLRNSNAKTWFGTSIIRNFPHFSNSQIFFSIFAILVWNSFKTNGF